MKPQKTSKSQSNLEKERQSWRHHNSGLQILLQNYSNENSMVLVQKQTHRSMEQNTEPQKEPMEKKIYGQLIFDKGGRNMQ